MKLEVLKQEEIRSTLSHQRPWDITRGTSGDDPRVGGVVLFQSRQRRSIPKHARPQVLPVPPAPIQVHRNRM